MTLPVSLAVSCLLWVLSAAPGPVTHDGVAGSVLQMIPGREVQPKDFSLTYEDETGLFHLFYTAQDQSRRRPDGTVEFDSTENYLGHSCSPDLRRWVPLPAVLHSREGRWDDLHVWAPHVLRRGNRWYMFYTGVGQDSLGRSMQRIGLATSEAGANSDSLRSWSRDTTWVLSHLDIPWACHDTSRAWGQQFRDPFVMPDPGRPEGFLMYFVTSPGDAPSHLVIGVARSDGDLRRWRDAGRVRIRGSSALLGDRIESPHIVASRSSVGSPPRYWLMFTAVHHQGASVDELRIVPCNAGSPAENTWGTWGHPRQLRDVAPDLTSAHWRGSEWLDHSSKSWLAAYDDSLMSIELTEMHWPDSSDAPGEGFAVPSPPPRRPESKRAR